MNLRSYRDQSPHVRIKPEPGKEIWLCGLYRRRTVDERQRVYSGTEPAAQRIGCQYFAGKKWIKRYAKLNEVLLSNIQSIKETLDSASLGLSQPTGGSVAEMSELLKRLNNLNGSMQKQMTKADIAKQEPASEIQNMDDLYESQKTEVHIYGI